MLYGTTVNFKTPLLPYYTHPFKTCILRTAVSIKKMYTHDSALQMLMPTFTIQLLGNDSPVGISADFKPSKQQRCGYLKFQSCYIPNLMRLDDRKYSVFIFEQ
jgi:hypothetical protein